MVDKNSKAYHCWNNYCKGRVKDMEFDSFIFNIKDEDDEVVGTRHIKIMGGGNIRGIDAYFATSFNRDYWDYFIYVDKKLIDNKEFTHPVSMEELENTDQWFQTTMVTMQDYLARLEFDWISSYCRSIIESNWDEIGMEELIIEKHNL